MVSSTTSAAANSKAVPPEFTLTVLPPSPDSEEGVSDSPANEVVTSTNSTALPLEFTFNVLFAALP